MTREGIWGGDAMIELEGFKERLTPKGLRVLETAIDESKKRQHYYLGVEHIFLSFAMVEDAFFRDIMSDLNLDANQVVQFLTTNLIYSPTI